MTSAPATDPTLLGGTWFVAPTPFDEGGSVDPGSQRRVVEAALAWGVEGLTAMGIASEAAALAPGERIAALDAIFRSAGGRIPVAVGCSGSGPEVVIDLMRQAKALGAAAAMVSAPPLHRDVDRLPSFFARIAAEGGLPVIVQDEPAATGVVIPDGMLLACVGAAGARVIKLEDPPTPPKIGRLLDGDPTLRIFGGLGGVSALDELRRGACGTMTGFAFPEILRAVREAHGSGDAERAAALFDRYLPLIQFEAQPVIGLSIRKELLRRRGAIATAVARRSPPLDPATLAELDDVLRRTGVRPSPDRFEPD